MMRLLNEVAKNYIGIREGTQEHREIINKYNNISPIPRGYNVSYSDSWCMVFVSVIALECDYKNFPFECSVPIVYNDMLVNGLITNEPKAGDLIFYSWACNNLADHVGIVDTVEGNIITTIEGNYNDEVKKRTIDISNACILAFGDTSLYYGVDCEELTIHQLALKALRGDFGNGSDRVNALGSKYEKVQEEINKILLNS